MTDAMGTKGLFAVVGVTGQQGGATAEALLAAGARVRGLVRDVQSTASRTLAEQGVELVQADLDRPDSLVEAFGGSEAVFAMTTFAGPDGTDGEIEHGKAIGDALVAAGVPRVVYSSVGGAERHTGIPHFESKRAVEEYLDTLQIRSTYLRPTFFMDNFARYSKPSVEDGTVVVRLPLPPGVPLQMVATRDIGRAAAVALTQPERIPADAVEIAGDERTGEQIAEAVGQAEGMPSRYEAVPLQALSGDPDQQRMFGWFAQTPAYQADFELTRDLVGGVWDLPTWLSHR